LRRRRTLVAAITPSTLITKSFQESFSMAQDNLPFDPTEAAECAGRLAEISDRGRLASLALAQPLLVARQGQLQRERLRIRSQRGPDDPRLAGLDAAIALAEGRINELEIATEILTVDTPAAPEQGAVVYGRVTQKGHGRRDLVVAAMGPEGQVKGFGCSGAAGAFQFQLPSGEGWRLRVTDKEGASLWRDQESFALADGDMVRREIDLAAAPPECPVPEDDGDQLPRTARVPNLIGRGEAEALRLLLAAALRRGTRGEEDTTDNVGLVVKQSPRAGREVAIDSAVDIVVGVAPGLEMPDLKGLALQEALARLRELDLQAEEPTFTPSAEFEGRVIQHVPVAGAKVPPGQAVVLLVGSKPTASVPDPRKRSRGG
jgi:hypothetical protein